jgi:hypothetical protein
VSEMPAAHSPLRHTLRMWLFREWGVEDTGCKWGTGAHDLINHQKRNQYHVEIKLTIFNNTS